MPDTMMTEHHAEHQVLHYLRRHVPWLTAVVGLALLLGGLWLWKQAQTFLSSEHQWGDWKIVPSGYHSARWNSLRWEQLAIKHPDQTIILKKLSLDIRLGSRKTISAPIWIQSDSVWVKLHPDSSALSQETTTSKHKNLNIRSVQIPLRTHVAIDYLYFEPDSTIPIEAHELKITSLQNQTVELQWKGLQTPKLHSPIDGSLFLTWPHEFLDAHGKLTTLSDTLVLDLEAPAHRLQDLNIDIHLQSLQPIPWLPISWPSSAPSLTQFSIQGRILADLNRKDLQFNASFKMTSDSVWKLPPFHWNGTVQGDQNLDLALTLEGLGPQQESIFLAAQINQHADIQASGEIHGIPLQFGSTLQSADLQIQHFQKKGDQLELQVMTEAGSEIQAHLENLDDPVIQVHANLAEKEPWAEKWCKGNLTLRPPSTIQGEFQKGTLVAHVHSGVEHAYRATAESFDTDLKLTQHGIELENGLFTTRNVNHHFRGRVYWSEPNSHVQFEIFQDSIGTIRVFTDMEGHVSVSASKLATHRIPLADTSLFKGVHAWITGNWEHWFAQEQGLLRASVETNFRGRPVDLQIHARKNHDSVTVEKVIAQSLQNSLQAHGLLTLKENQPPSIQLAEVSTDSFALAPLLEMLGDSTLHQATLSGSLKYDQPSGLQGKLSLNQIQFRSIDSSQLQIRRLNLYGIGDEIQLNGRVKLGPDGFWSSEVEIDLSQIFQPNKQLDLAMISDYGGIFWMQGFLDSAWNWKGEARVEGPWILPMDGLELHNTFFRSFLEIHPQKGLNGIHGVFALDTATLIHPLLSIPLQLRGTLLDHMIQLDTIQIWDHDHHPLKGRLAIDLETKHLKDIYVRAPLFQFTLDSMHHITIKDLKGDARQEGNHLLASLQMPEILYSMDNDLYGSAKAQLSGELQYRLPLAQDGSMQNPLLSGLVNLHRLQYNKNLKIDINQIAGIWKSTTQKLKKLGQSASQVKVSSKRGQSNPLDLDIRIQDSGRDSLYINTNIFRIPFTTDIQILGTAETPLLQGDITAVGSGVVELGNITHFDVDQFRIWWPDVPIKKGEIQVVASQKLPYCEQNSDESLNEECDVNISVQGPLTEPVPTPSAQCDAESSPALVYYSILTGCIAESTNNGLDRDQLVNKLLAQVLSSTVNQGLGGQYVGDIGLNIRFLDNGSLNERDSNYVRIPIKLDRWVPRLSLEVAYSQDQSLDPRYDQSYELGLKYSMPVLDSGRIVTNHLDPNLEFSGNLISRNYPGSAEGDAQEENRIEKNLGILYSWKFWDFCLFGLGSCAEEESDETEEPQP